MKIYIPYFSYSVKGRSRQCTIVVASKSPANYACLPIIFD